MSDQNDVNANFAEDANNDSNGSCGCSGLSGSSGGKGKMIAFVLVMLFAFGIAAYSIAGKDKTSVSACGSCPDAIASQGAVCGVEKGVVAEKACSVKASSSSCPESALAGQGAVCGVEKGVAAEKDCSVKASASCYPGSVDQVSEKEQK